MAFFHVQGTILTHVEAVSKEHARQLVNNKISGTGIRFLADSARITEDHNKYPRQGGDRVYGTLQG